ncbi:rhomboid protease GluP [Evansella vedderi]|uniref:Rhomboid protease GluP n=1 Tax=Evansella vedderi TaxID=38282 RepID=A0ABT9ZT51_9BACI|nr:rhomboid family intramembrane serine protease [Evansella vedderi]MDQ0254415.1 rhomboid protease GluP [Evansella vedderi]
MNRLVLELRFWEVVYHLVNREGMRVVHISQSGEEIWLEDDRQEPFQIIRIAQKDFDWSNQMRSDIESAFERGKQVRKQLNLRSANVINLTLSLYEPVDSYEELIDQALPFTAGGKNQQRTILIPIGKLQEKFFPLATEWKLKEMPQFLSYDQMTDPEAVINSLRYSVQKASESRVEKEKQVFFYGKPILTFLLLGIILIIFAIVERFGSTTDTLTLISFGAKFNPLILEGEWWRFFSAMFLHIGIFHLLMNSLALFYLGSAVERIYGTSRFFFIYFLAGLVGSVASFSFNEHVSAGASGAIFGCFGALLYFGVIHHRLFFRTMGMNVIVILMINLGFGFMVPMVDNGAHIGGLIGGFAASAIVGLPNTKKVKKRFLALILTIAGIVGLLHYGYSQEETTQSYIVYLQIGQEYLQNNELENAKLYFGRIIDGNLDLAEPILTETYFLLAYIQATMDNLDEAEEHLLYTIERNPEFHEAHYNLSLVYMEQRRYEEAYDQLQEALAIEPDVTEYKQLEQQLRYLKNQ